jgi:hypothetical protein
MHPRNLPAANLALSGCGQAQSRKVRVTGGPLLVGAELLVPLDQSLPLSIVHTLATGGLLVVVADEVDDALDRALADAAFLLGRARLLLGHGPQLLGSGGGPFRRCRPV